MNQSIGGTVKASQLGDYNYSTDVLSRGASNAGCSDITFIKECVRLYNSKPRTSALTLTIVTSHTEHYTGDDSNSSNS